MVMFLGAAVVACVACVFFVVACVVAVVPDVGFVVAVDADVTAVAVVFVAAVEEVDAVAAVVSVVTEVELPPIAVVVPPVASSPGITGACVVPSLVPQEATRVQASISAKIMPKRQSIFFIFRAVPRQFFKLCMGAGI